MRNHNYVTFKAICILCLLKFVNGNILSGIVNDVIKSISTDMSTSDVSLNVTQLITKYGYTAEEYNVITEDGYILTLNRILGTGPAVFVMHGLLNSGSEILTLGPHDAIGYLLANASYDVWIGNVRGSKYSRNHVSLSPEEKPFWNFTFHEMGYYDLPAMIDFALEKSNRSQLTYVGHSQGTTVFYVMASTRPEYNSKVSLMVSMATIAWLSHARTPVFGPLVLLRYEEALIANVLGFYEILPYDAFWRFITGRVCPSSRFTLFVCASVLFAVYGYDYHQLDYSRFPVEIGQIPGGSSIKQLLHFAQLVASGKFRQFDYKIKERNEAAYGKATPPEYPVENITVPIAIMHGNNDLISSFTDVEILISKLQKVVEVYKVPFPYFNHMDFLWAKDAKKFVYFKVMDLIKNQGVP